MTSHCPNSKQARLAPYPEQPMVAGEARDSETGVAQQEAAPQQHDFLSLNRLAMVSIEQDQPEQAYHYLKKTLIAIKAHQAARRASSDSNAAASFPPARSADHEDQQDSRGYRIISLPQEDKHSHDDGTVSMMLPLVFDIDTVVQDAWGSSSHMYPNAALNLAAAIVIYNMATLMQVATSLNPPASTSNLLQKVAVLYSQTEKFVVESHESFSQTGRPSGKALLDLFRLCHLHNWSLSQSASQSEQSNIERRGFAYLSAVLNDVEEGRSSSESLAGDHILVDHMNMIFSRSCRRLFPNSIGYPCAAAA